MKYVPLTLKYLFNFTGFRQDLLDIRLQTSRSWRRNSSPVLAAEVRKFLNQKSTKSRLTCSRWCYFIHYFHSWNYAGPLLFQIFKFFSGLEVQFPSVTFWDFEGLLRSFDFSCFHRTTHLKTFNAMSSYFFLFALFTRFSSFSHRNAFRDIFRTSAHQWVIKYDNN